MARSFVLDEDDRFAPLQEQWHDHVRRRFHRGPDPQQAALDAIVDQQPRAVLEVGAGSGQFAAHLGDRVDASVLITDTSPLLIGQAHMRHLAGIVAAPTALPLASARFDCVLARRPQWSDPDLGPALREVVRVLDRHGTLLIVAASPRADGHELDALIGRRLRRRTVALTAESGEAVLSRHFTCVERTSLDYAMVFPSGTELASYLRATPARRHLAERVCDLSGPFRLTYRVQLFTASTPRTTADS